MKNSEFGASPSERAYCGPFLLFLGVLMLGQIVAGVFDGRAAWPLAKPEYWVHPLQVIVCAVLLFRCWPHYELRAPRGVAFTVFIGVLALVLWIAPQAFFHAAPRLKGFDPAFFGTDGAPYFLNVGIRFIRLVIVVPLVEEIFWRGFLLRWLIRDDFTNVPIGTFQWKSFGLVALLFMLEHAPADYPAAIVTGALFNWVAIRTRSLASCVLVHAVTNLLLGIYIMRTGQLGFW